MSVQLSPEARTDLVEIGRFIGRDSPARAIAFVASLERQCLALKQNFLRHPIFRRSENDSIRHLIYREYMSFYRVEPELVGILRIVHGARNLDALFDLETPPPI